MAESSRDELVARVQQLAQVDKLTARVEQLTINNEQLRVQLDNRIEDQHELDQLLGRMSGLLHRTANALKGEPDELTWHDWSDLPAVAKALVQELDSYRAKAAT